MPQNLRHQRSIVLINGPVGIGKTTTAFATANWLRSNGHHCSCVDLDEIYRMIRQKDGFGDSATWQQTRRAAAVLASHLMQGVTPIVLIEGGFYSPTDLDELALPKEQDVKSVFVTLHASFGQVSKRVQDDPDMRRVASRDPVILAQLYAEYAAALPYLRTSSTIIDVDSLSVAEVAAQVGELVINTCKPGA